MMTGMERLTAALNGAPTEKSTPISPGCRSLMTLGDPLSGRLVGLPLRWLDVTLDHLEEHLEKAINRKTREPECLK